MQIKPKAHLNLVSPVKEFVGNLFNSSKVVDLNTFDYSTTLGTGKSLILMVKGFDAKRLKKNFRANKNTDGNAVFGSVQDCGINGRIGAVLKKRITNKSKTITKNSAIRNKYFDYNEIHNPRDLCTVGGKTYLVGHKAIYSIKTD